MDGAKIPAAIYNEECLPDKYFINIRKLKECNRLTTKIIVPDNLSLPLRKHPGTEKSGELFPETPDIGTIHVCHISFLPNPSRLSVILI
jgi:hypothetical protein